MNNSEYSGCTSQLMGHKHCPDTIFENVSDNIAHLMNIQGDLKVTQPILKHLLMVTIQYSSIGLINTQYRCDYTRAHTSHVML
jgi:hypothetical protein